MTIFKITLEDGRAVDIVCESKSTRNGFKHEATLLIAGYQQTKVKCMYYNRTWESFTYQTVAHKAIEALKSKELVTEIKQKFKEKYNR